MAYDNTNRWTLNRNTDKQSETHSDFKGKINIEGVGYWLNGWTKAGPNGNFISGTVKRVQPAHVNPSTEQSISQRAQATINRPDPISSGLSMNDDIPF